jgi:hypothetical protein
VCVATLLLTACGGSGGDAPTGTPPVTPVDNTPSSIALSPSGSVTIASGASTTINATVQAKDGHALSGQTVSWSASDAAVASVSSSGTVTGAKAGTATITATSGSLTASLTATVTPGSVSTLVIRTQPGDGTSGAALSRQPVVELRDAAGNLTTSTASVTAAIASGGGTLSGTSTVSALAGVAAFTNLAISGSAGARTLTFGVTGASAATSASINVAASTTPIVVLDSASVTLYAFPGVTPTGRTLGITNGGPGTLSGLTVDAISYDAGATGWLSTSLGGASSLTVTPTATSGLSNGTYHATVTVRAAGGATTGTLTVTLIVAAVPSITYVQQSARVVLTPVGTALQPTVTLTSGTQTLPASVATFTSRAATVATVDAAGRITPVAAGGVFIIAQAPGGGGDSIYVTVLPKTGPVILLDLQKYSAAVGENLVINMSLDTRGVSVGSFDATFGYPDRGNPVTLVTFTAATGTPAPVVNSSQRGIIRVSWASATGARGVIPLLQITLKGVAGDPAVLTATLLDIFAPDLTDLSASSTSTLYPIRVP